MLLTNLLPGDKGGKTKPSKHTKKFKQMFGEITQTESVFKDLLKGLLPRKLNIHYTELYIQKITKLQLTSIVN